MVAFQGGYNPCNTTTNYGARKKRQVAVDPCPAGFVLVKIDIFWGWGGERGVVLTTRFFRNFCTGIYF
jgi:hypothetical protein